MSGADPRPGAGVSWLIGGTAGEGLESGGEAFARALAASGHRPTTQRDFPSRIRGGDTTFTVRLAAGGRLVPPHRIDLALAFNDTVLPRIDARMSGGGLLLLDEGKVGDFVPSSGCDVASFPFSAMAQEAGLPRAKNVVALGVSTALLGLPLDAVAQSVGAQFRHKGEDVVAGNQAALRKGYGAAVDRFGETPRFQAPEATDGPALFLSGNEAACLGALASGCRIAAAYPITPASDVLEYLTPRLQQLGGVALQMEDEMAALNACVGAGFAGAKALTATSGPGLSLMTETIGLAGSTETPVVVLDCQRPGPSTGMPTKHGQEDLWHLIHGGHGEFVRAVLAPTDVADCFEATSEAFWLSERFRCPAFVALDQQMCLFKQTVAPFDLDGEAQRHGVRDPPPAPGPVGEDGLPGDAWSGAYRPYGDAGDRPARISLPGEQAPLYYSNSTEHAPTGFTTEDPAARVAMVRRRLDRMAAIARDARRPVVVEGAGGAASPDDPDVVLLSWGSTVEACREAADRLAEEGTTARVVAVRLLWPFPRDAVAAAVAGDAPIVVAEANALGQMGRLLRSELPVHDRVHACLRYDGEPLSGDDVIAAVPRREVVA